MSRFFRKGMRVFLFLATLFWLSAIAVGASEDPVVIELHYQNGVKFFKRGLYERAVVELKRTLALDPTHEEAKAYLEKIKSLQVVHTTTEAKQDKDKEIRRLTQEARAQYLKHDDEGARDIFNKILELDPVNELASFYKERCEIFISRKLAKEKKIEDQKRLKDEKIKERADQKNQKEMKKLERQAMLKQRKKISKERIQKREEREEKKLAAQQQKADSIKAKEERKGEKKAAKEKSQEEKTQRGKERKTKKQERGRQKAETKRHKKEIVEEQKNTKELFLTGVQHYGRRQYPQAIKTFQAIIDAERQTEKTYTPAAQRLMEKAKSRLQQSEK